MRPECIEAVETRTEWLRWALSPKGRGMFEIRDSQNPPAPLWEDAKDGEIVRGEYARALATADLFVMVAPFCRLVEHARASTPPDLAFDARWLHAPAGWLWLAEPFRLPAIAASVTVPEIAKAPPVGIRAVGWAPIPPGTGIRRNDGTLYQARAGLYHLTFFGEPISGAPWFVGFLPWSYPVLRDGDRLANRISEFEQDHANCGGADRYLNAPTAAHEVTWFYTACYLMAQRLAIRVHDPVERHSRRRAEREGVRPPDAVTLVTLRRLEADRRREGGERDVDWQWQWEVRGHWRNQWYPSEGIHKPAFIEAYIKGPPEKPLKPSAGKLFVAAR